MKNLVSESTFKHGGRHIVYKTNDGKEIGKLYTAQGCRIQFALPDGEYKKTEFRKITEARKALIDPLVKDK
jgi:hypothetical protein